MSIMTVMKNSALRASIVTPFVAAPAFLALYGIAHLIDGLDGKYGPGIAWTVGHIMFMAAMLTFGLVAVRLYQRVGLRTSKHQFIARLALALALIGTAVFIRVITIDIITGLLAANNA